MVLLSGLYLDSGAIRQNSPPVKQSSPDVRHLLSEDGRLHVINCNFRRHQETIWLQSESVQRPHALSYMVSVTGDDINCVIHGLVLPAEQKVSSGHTS